MLKNLLYLVLDILSPQKCIGCGKSGVLLCSNCAQKTKLAEPTKLGNIYSAGNYHDPVIKKAIWFLKYRGARSIAEPLAELMYLRLAKYLHLEAKLPSTPGSLASKSSTKTNDWLIVPVPLHRKRVKERGYNQSALLAKILSGKFNIPFNLNILYKIKATPTQVSIKNRRDRLENLIGSFNIVGNNAIDGKNIILVDDVTTTGATMAEASKTLKTAGAKKVVALTIARD